MMVERSPYTDNPNQLITDLNQLTQKIEEVSGPSAKLSEKELTELIGTLDDFNATFDESFWNEKKLVPEKADATIEKALKAVFLFQSTHPEKQGSGYRNVDQAIASLSSSLTSAIAAFDKNLKDLKKYKIGQKVEKTGESKHS